MDENKPPYFREWLTSQGNAYAALGAAAAAAVLSVPFGFGIGALPLVAFAAGELIAGMYVPASITFRDKVDRRYRQQARDATRGHLIGEIERRVQARGRGDGTLRIYGRMMQRIVSLYAMAEERQTELTVRDVEKLDEASLDFLYAKLALLVMEERAASIDLNEVERRVEKIDHELATQQSGMDAAQLGKARSDYLALAARHRRMLSRKTVLEAALLSIPDQMEEIYQTIVAAPSSREIGAKLGEAVANLRLREEIETELASDLESEAPGLVIPMRTGNAKAGRAAARQRA